MAGLILTHAEMEALLSAVVLYETDLEANDDDDSGAERQLQTLRSAWTKVQGAARPPVEPTERPRRPEPSAFRKRMRCPDCGKKGVTRRMTDSDDFFACRYCEFECYAHSDLTYDLERRQALAAVNPDHPLAPSREG